MKYLSQAVLAALSLSLASCSLFTKKEIDYSDKYVTGLGLDKNVSAEEIKKNLLRESSMGGGNVQLSAYPFTKALVERMVDETAAVRALTSSRKKELAERLDKEYLAAKTCFQIDISTKRTNKLASLSEWSLMARDGMQYQSALTWRQEDYIKPVITGKFDDFTGASPIYYLSGVACSASPLDVRSGIQLTITASEMNFPFSRSETLTFTFDQHEFKGGEVIQVEEAGEKEKKPNRPYQAW